MRPLLSRTVAGVLVVVAALLQVTIFERIELGSTSPDILMLVVASIALLTGAVNGAAYGFLAGLSIAMFAAVPLGPHALIGTLAGYFIGMWGEVLVTEEHPAPPLIAGALATMCMQLGWPLVEFLVNPAVRNLEGVITGTVVATMLAMILAVPMYVMVRRVLGAAGPWTSDSDQPSGARSTGVA